VCLKYCKGLRLPILLYFILLCSYAPWAPHPCLFAISQGHLHCTLRCCPFLLTKIVGCSFHSSCEPVSGTVLFAGMAGDVNGNGHWDGIGTDGPIPGAAVTWSCTSACGLTAINQMTGSLGQITASLQYTCVPDSLHMSCILATCLAIDMRVFHIY
jgi:hypothetical protein